MIRNNKVVALFISFLFAFPLSAYDRLTPGEYIPSLFEQRYSQPFVVQRLTENSYVAMVSAHNATFYVGKKGVLLIDTTLADTASGLVAAIHSVTSLPVTAVIYSHYHMDHVGGSNVIQSEFTVNGNNINFVATRAVAEHIERYGNKIPSPNIIIESSGGDFEFEGVKVKLHVPRSGGGHSPDNTIIYLPEERLLHYVDLLQPELLFPFFDLGISDILAAEESLVTILDMDWDYVNGGHGNVGSKKDVKELQGYLADLKAAVGNALESLSFAAHITQGPGDGVYTWIKNFDDALATQVKQALSDKYGHIRNYDAVVGSHAVALKSYFTLL